MVGRNIYIFFTFIAALFIVASLETNKMSLVGERVSKLRYTHTMKHRSELKRNELSSR